MPFLFTIVWYSTTAYFKNSFPTPILFLLSRKIPATDNYLSWMISSTSSLSWLRIAIHPSRLRTLQSRVENAALTGCTVTQDYNSEAKFSFWNNLHKLTESVPHSSSRLAAPEDRAAESRSGGTVMWKHPSALIWKLYLGLCSKAPSTSSLYPSFENSFTLECLCKQEKEVIKMEMDKFGELSNLKWNQKRKFILLGHLSFS